MRWSTACCNAPDETPWMRVMQSTADPDRRRPRADGTQLLILSSVLQGAVCSPVACSHWVDGVSRLRLLAKDCPGSGLRVTHWAENNAYPYLARSQNETLRDHVWCEIHTAWDMEFRPRTHAGEHAKNACCCRRGCKNPNYKIIHSARTINHPLNIGWDPT